MSIRSYYVFNHATPCEVPGCTLRRSHSHDHPTARTLLGLDKGQDERERAMLNRRSFIASLLAGATALFARKVTAEPKPVPGSIWYRVNGGLERADGRPPRCVNVKDYGAVGDGVHDDTDAVRRAMATACVVYFPSGTYRMTDALTCAAFASR